MVPVASGADRATADTLLSLGCRVCSLAKWLGRGLRSSSAEAIAVADYGATVKVGLLACTNTAHRDDSPHVGPTPS
jgi:hypothetical protein